MRFSLANLQHGFARLAPRERLFVAVGGATLVALLLFFVTYELGSVQSGMQDRIAAKRTQLDRAQALRSEILELRRQASEFTIKDPNRSPNWLYSTLEALLTKSLGREKIDSMAPSSKSVNEQTVEDSVNVHLVGVTLQQMVSALYEIEHTTPPIYVSRLQVKKRVADPYQFDVNLSVSSIKAAS